MNKSRRGQIKALGHGRRRAGGKRAQRIAKTVAPRGLPTSLQVGKLCRRLDALIAGIVQTLEVAE